MKSQARIPAPHFVEQVFVAKEAPNIKRLGSPLARIPGHIFLITAALVAFFFASSVPVRSDPGVTLYVGYPDPVTSLSFDLAADPTGDPTVAASPASFTVEVVTTNTTTWTLDVSAAQPYLDPGSNEIGVGEITWSATGTGFVGGTLSVTSQSVASGSGSGTFTGTISFSMANKWTYPSGTYTDTITYTATAI